jgi:hypothetical protein
VVLDNFQISGFLGRGKWGNFGAQLKICIEAFPSLTYRIDSIFLRTLTVGPTLKFIGTHLVGDLLRVLCMYGAAA